MDFEWDDANIEHLAGHRITPDEVEELFEGKTLHRRGGTDRPDRLRILGRTASGRYLAIVCQQKGRQLLRPFTGWDMRPHERRLYERHVRAV